MNGSTLSDYADSVVGNLVAFVQGVSLKHILFVALFVYLVGMLVLADKIVPKFRPRQRRKRRAIVPHRPHTGCRYMDVTDASEFTYDTQDR